MDYHIKARTGHTIEVDKFNREGDMMIRIMRNGSAYAFPVVTPEEMYNFIDWYRKNVPDPRGIDYNRPFHPTCAINGCSQKPIVLLTFQDTTEGFYCAQHERDATAIVRRVYLMDKE